MQLLPRPQNNKQLGLETESTQFGKSQSQGVVKHTDNISKQQTGGNDAPQKAPRLRMNSEVSLSFEGISSEEEHKGYLSKSPVLPHEERVAIFIDGANLFYAAMHLNLEIDYTKLLRCLTKGRQLLRAYFYTPVDNTNEKQQGFLLWMRRNGYRVFTKELVYHLDGSKKANMDVEITVDMLTLAKYCDTVILLSGDGDLAYAVNAIAYQGVQIEVVSLSSMTSESLIDVADCYTDLDEIREEIQK
jgi:uncharacterized LabA/DUF88 family protein